MAEPAEEAVDPGWKGLYRAAGVSMLIIGIIFLVGTVFFFSLGPPPSSGEVALKSLAGQTVLARTTFGLFVLADLLFVPVVPALYLALKGINRNAMLVAAGFLGLFIVLDLGVTSSNSLSLVTFSENYAAATSDAQRAAYVAAADYALATTTVSLPIFSTIVPAIGVLITGLVMRKGIFSRATAYLGIATSILGIVSGIGIIIPALGILLAIASPLYGIWNLLAGSKLYKLGRR